ncbi:TetR/AcrR family transcriptional regulator [Christensenellaceae bacterium OttesenSCG-928-M15]|nr:TetR/AcrR family transcriptional regulator [Christensenellaceae bacterium OttesenSCG-928-M15]
MKLKIQQIVEDMARTKTLDKIRIQDICSAAGISMGNFYLYFSCKEEAIIYSYQYIDEKWKEERFENIQDPLTRVITIIDTHLATIADETLCFITQLYISQLKLYDDYFFTRQRYLHQVLADALHEAQNAGQITRQYEAADLAVKLLNFSRGLVYNYCIQHKEEPEAWLRFAKGEQREYMQLFMT